MLQSQLPAKAALFIDYENIYYFFRKELANSDTAADVSLDLLFELNNKLKKEMRMQSLVMKAYGDFERIEDNSQSQLYLMGIEPQFVMGTDHKNAADMRLAIDALEVFYTRQEITTFVFVAGDRDYIPLIMHLRQHDRRVLVVAFHENISGDLLEIIGKENFLEAKSLLPSEVKLKGESKGVAAPGVRQQTMMPTTPAPSASKFAKWRKLEDEDHREALSIMLEHFGSKPEVWVTPYLHKLRQSMSQLAEYERKAIITELTDSGAIRVERRQGETNEYSVILINWDHPDVVDLNPGPVV
ncbi:MAG: NYN domain-containing protein [Fimbriimonadaceae bacterium]|nr:NYN domain-containing protein [Fimbriimonadaceae bacterium]